VIEGIDDNNFHFDLFCEPNHHLITHNYYKIHRFFESPFMIWDPTFQGGYIFVIGIESNCHFSA